MKNFKSISKTFLFFCIIGLAITTVSCSDSPTNVDDGNQPTPDEFVKITTHSGKQYNYTLYALSDSLQTGYNEIYIAVENNQGKTVDLQNPEVIPLMNMGNMTHSTPISGIETVNKRGRNYLKVDVFFTMNSMPDMLWTLKVKGQVAGETISEKVYVKVPEKGLMATNKINNTTYYLSYVEPKVPVTGGDIYKIAIHSTENMMDFAPVTGATVRLKPFMDMGHGEGHSTNHYDKVATEKSPGRYQGDIVYIMAGEWQLTFTFTLSDGTKIAFPPKPTFKIMVEQ